MNNKLIDTEKNIIFYNDEEGNIKIEVLLENEDVWLNTEAIVFQKTKAKFLIKKLQKKL